MIKKAFCLSYTRQQIQKQIHHSAARWILAGLATITAWLIISSSISRRSGLGLDLTTVSTNVIYSLEDSTHRFDFFDSSESKDWCPGPQCPLNQGRTELLLRNERKITGNINTMIAPKGWRRTMYIAWDVKVPTFVKQSKDPIAFDFYGISGKSWKFFVNGKLVSDGVGASQLPPIIFEAPDIANEPMTIGFEIDVGRSFAPGVIHIAQVFMSQPETANKFRLAYRGLDHAAILPTATGFALIAMLAGLGCFFTPFFKEILVFSVYVSLFNWRLLIVNDMATFPSFLRVDFVTMDAILRSALFASMWAFWGLYFRIKSGLKWLPVAIYSSLAICFWFIGRTGVGLESLVYYMKTIDIHQTAIYAGATIFAFKTWRSAQNFSWAKFRSYSSLLLMIFSAMICISFLLKSIINFGGITWDSFRVYEPLYFFANYSVRAFVLGLGLLIAMEWALIVRDRQKVLQRFGTIVDPRLITEIIRGNNKSSRKVENVIALFVDLRSFTKICDIYEADVVTKALNDYLSIVTDAVQSHDGVVDKFVGDAVMATWGVPSAEASDSINALRAALSIRIAMNNLNKKRADAGEFPLQIGMGIHRGEAIFGAIGNGARVDHTIIGATVNIASRIQDLSKKFSCDILVSRQFYESVSQQCLADQLGMVELRGISSPIEILKVIGVSTDGTSDVIIGDKILENAVATRKPGLISNTPPNLLVFEHRHQNPEKPDTDHKAA
jgi:class 3 adenylate cyclase